MKLTKNWQRYLVMNIFDVLFLLLMFFILYLLNVVYNIPFSMVLIVYTLSVLSVVCEPFSASENFYKKHCNRECEGCKMWHCNVCSKADK